MKLENCIGAVLKELNSFKLPDSAHFFLTGRVYETRQILAILEFVKLDKTSTKLVGICFHTTLEIVLKDIYTIASQMPA